MARNHEEKLDQLAEQITVALQQLAEERTQRQLEIADARLRLTSLDESHSSFEELEHKVSGLDQRLEELGKRLKAVTSEVQAQIPPPEIELRFTTMQAQLEAMPSEGCGSFEIDQLEKRVKSCEAMFQTRAQQLVKQQEAFAESLEQRLLSKAVDEACSALKEESDWWHTEVIRLDADVARATARLDTLERNWDEHLIPKASNGLIAAAHNEHAGRGNSCGPEGIRRLSEWVACLDTDVGSLRVMCSDTQTEAHRAGTQSAESQRGVDLLRQDVDQLRQTTETQRSWAELKKDVDQLRQVLQAQIDSLQSVMETATLKVANGSIASPSSDHTTRGADGSRRHHDTEELRRLSEWVACLDTDVGSLRVMCTETQTESQRADAHSTETQRGLDSLRQEMEQLQQTFETRNNWNDLKKDVDQLRQVLQVQMDSLQSVIEMEALQVAEAEAAPTQIHTAGVAAIPQPTRSALTAPVELSPQMPVEASSEVVPEAVNVCIQFDSPMPTMALQGSPPSRNLSPQLQSRRSSPIRTLAPQQPNLQHPVRAPSAPSGDRGQRVVRPTLVQQVVDAAVGLMPTRSPLAPAAVLASPHVLREEPIVSALSGQRAARSPAVRSRPDVHPVREVTGADEEFPPAERQRFLSEIRELRDLNVVLRQENMEIKEKLRGHQHVLAPTRPFDHNARRSDMVARFPTAAVSGGAASVPTPHGVAPQVYSLPIGPSAMVRSQAAVTATSSPWAQTLHTPCARAGDA